MNGMASSMSQLDSDIQAFTTSILSRPDDEFVNPHDLLKLIRWHQEPPEQRLRMLHEAQRRTHRAVFLTHQRSFYTTRFHYDWFVFPMFVPREWNWVSRDYDCSVTLEDGRQLVDIGNFLEVYLDSIHRYLSAVEKYGWNDYPVRYSKMTHSLGLFLQVLHSLREEKKEALEKLKVLGGQALTFAQNHLVERYPDYSLLHSGLALIRSNK
eukprot:gb/GECG01000282.1/.p1 GENE.gb/GECG01000282.1/~~gb/GECG01000282.1/.p1  ORF type:complete len:210 (+),score=21.94 gb/GECG01000282.1/:1-630(+)